MRRLLLSTLLVLPLSLAGAGVAVADDGHLCTIAPTGRDFGRHVAMHAQLGVFDGSMNPGMHQGYSTCAR